MRSRSGSWILLIAATAAPADAGPEPGDIDGVTREAGARIAALRKVERASRDARTEVIEVLDLLRPFVDDVRKLFRENEKKLLEPHRLFAYRYNEALTLAYFHKVRVRDEYICWSRTLAHRRLLVDLPATPHWKLRYKRGDQLKAEITQSRPSGKPLRKIEVWRYRWDTLYDGVGGENYKKLAEQIHELDRDEARATGGKASRLYVKRLSREFKRAYYYTVELHDSELNANVRRREYYIKGKSATFNFAIVDFWEAASGDDAVTLFQAQDDGVELMHLLQSLRLND